MGVTRTGMDRILVAHKLWECCAIPEVLYCIEASVISKACIDKLDSIKHKVARFILQMPKLASHMCG